MRLLLFLATIANWLKKKKSKKLYGSVVNSGGTAVKSEKDEKDKKDAEDADK